MNISPQELRAQHRFRIEVIDGHTWEVLEIDGPGTPVIFLAGAQGTSEVFYAPMLRFAGRRAMRGIHYPAISDARALASGLAMLLDRLDIAKVAIVGSSFGAYVAQFFAAEFGDRVDHLILGNTFYDAEEVKSIPLFNVDALNEMGPDALKAGRLADLEKAPDSEFKGVLQDQMGARQTAKNLFARLMGVAISTPAPLADLPIEKITLIDCEDDKIIGPQMRTLIQSRYSGADLRVLPTGGHFPHILNQEGFCAILDDKLFQERSPK